ncbi:MAG TPA: response regulator transcription factor [Candidatus Dormibacteraeota bacterium]|jgi:DNA-binding NarL/FixJ family response regulator
MITSVRTAGAQSDVVGTRLTPGFGPTRIRVMVADDHTLFREGLAKLLSDDGRVEVVATACNGQEAVRVALEAQPEVIFMDLKMPLMEGIEATRQILARLPETKVLILTTFDADTHVLQALKAGARGYVLKDATLDAIVRSAQSVMAGDRVMGGRAGEVMLDLITHPKLSAGQNDGLTRREVEILRLIASGFATKQVGYRLQISDKTVRNHVSNIYEKLDIGDRSQAVLYAVRKGLVDI